MAGSGDPRRAAPSRAGRTWLGPAAARSSSSRSGVPRGGFTLRPIPGVVTPPSTQAPSASAARRLYNTYRTFDYQRGGRENDAEDRRPPGPPRGARRGDVAGDCASRNGRRDHARDRARGRRLDGDPRSLLRRQGRSPRLRAPSLASPRVRAHHGANGRADRSRRTPREHARGIADGRGAAARGTDRDELPLGGVRERLAARAPEPSSSNGSGTSYTNV